MSDQYKFQLTERIDSAVSRLMTASHDYERTVINVPVLYPSGAATSIEVSLSGDKCFVSDMGQGHSEALLSNAQDFYDHYAGEIAEKFGIGFDGMSVFALWVSVDRLEGAIVCVANASAQAANNAIMRAFSERDRKKTDELYDRVTHIFGRQVVTKKQEIVGRHAEWEAHNVVLLPTKTRAIFEFVSPHPNSISSKFMMFSDLSVANNDFSLNSVVSRISDFNAKGEMLADVSNIIQLDSSDQEYKRYAKAA